MPIFSPAKIILSLGIAGLLLSGAAGAKEPVTSTTPAVQTETLMRSGASWDGTPYTTYPQGAPELTVLKITIPPHTSLPWHTHPMPNAAYVVSGELTVEKKESGNKDENKGSGKPLTQVLKPGQVLPEMVGALHRGTTGDEPVVLIVFYAGVKDMPLAQH